MDPITSVVACMFLLSCHQPANSLAPVYVKAPLYGAAQTAPVVTPTRPDPEMDCVRLGFPQCSGGN